MEEGTENVMNPHDKMRARSVSRVATGQQAPRPAHEPGTIADAPPLTPELTDESGRVELKTTPLDARFPFANQTRHCYTRYIEYHLCIKETSGESGQCEKFARYYRSLCPTDWIMEWNRQREEGIFSGLIWGLFGRDSLA